jgi:hypothetical protein
MEIDLAPYEESVIMVTGQPGGGWIYEAEVVEKADPILAVVAREVFKPRSAS